ncbi:sigma-54-dependent Fis family transcriptional regulator, partial [bacterium]|nr:sigma-54-dependent Fis family transcriptional regulator [bacterium]
LEFQEKESITKALKQFEGNQAKVSRYLGIARTTLRKKLNKFNIDPIHFKNY